MLQKWTCTSTHMELDKALLIWIKLLSGERSLRQKCHHLQQMLGIDDFTSSDGLLTRFKNRHDVIFKGVCWKVSVDQETCMSRRAEKLHEYLSEYQAVDTFNAARAALYHLPPKRPWHSKTATVLGANEVNKGCWKWYSSKHDCHWTIPPACDREGC